MFISLEKKKLISGFGFAPFPGSFDPYFGFHIYPEKKEGKKKKTVKIHGNSGPISDHGPFLHGSNHNVPWMRSLYLIIHPMLIGQSHCFNVYDGVSGDNFQKHGRGP